MRDRLLTAYQQFFKEDPEYLVRSPGRVNIIGEHTDYNEGFVLPMALDESTWLMCSPRDDDKICAYSLNFNEHENIELHELDKPLKMTWTEYVKGVAYVLQKHFQQPLQGFNAVIYTDIPMGAGLSSSASFELAVAKALSFVNNLPWHKTEMAKLCQQAENEWVGVNCGIMDQMICAIAEQGHASLIDCRDYSYQAAPLPSDCVIVILDTATRRGLVDSAYNERRKQCETAAKALGIPALRDITLTKLLAQAHQLDPLVFKRAKHIVSENERVQQALQAMRKQDARTLGRLLVESHNSLDQDFQVTNDALNSMVTCAINTPGCFGARMTGAGFGGCAVALVEKRLAMEFKQIVASAYHQKTGLTPSIYVSQANNGCHLEHVAELLCV